MIGKKIGTLNSILNRTDLDEYILKVFWDDPNTVGGDMSFDELKKIFKIKLNEQVNFIMIKHNNEKQTIIISLSNKKQVSDMPVLSTKYTFAIHYLKPNFPIYDSEY